jgi:hypothetical protein
MIGLRFVRGHIDGPPAITTNEENTDDGDGPAQGASMLLMQSKWTSTTAPCGLLTSTSTSSATPRPRIPRRHQRPRVRHHHRLDKTCYRLAQGF